MRRRGRIPKQLDIPLVWDSEGGSKPAPAARAEAVPQAGEAFATGGGWLIPAAVADVGLMLVGCAAAAAVARLAGADLNSEQLAAVIVAGIAIVSAVSIAVLWAWRGTIGMLLMGLNFLSPLGFARAVGVWAVCTVSWPLAGVPLALGWRGLERLAQSRLRCHSARASA